MLSDERLIFLSEIKGRISPLFETESTLVYALILNYLSIQKYHYENTPMQHTATFHGSKNANFRLNVLTSFIFLLKT